MSEPENPITRLRALLTPEVRESLGPEGRQAVLAGALLVALSDGTMAKSEHRTIAVVGGCLDLKHADLETVASSLDENDAIAKLKAANLTPDARKAVIASLGVIAMADGKLTGSETSLVESFGAALGHTPEDCKSIVKEILGRAPPPPPKAPEPGTQAPMTMTDSSLDPAFEQAAANAVRIATERKKKKDLEKPQAAAPRPTAASALDEHDKRVLKVRIVVGLIVAVALWFGAVRPMLPTFFPELFVEKTDEPQGG